MKSVIIDRLIEIEESARDITKGVHEQEKGLPSLIQKECDDIEAKYRSEYEKKTAEIRVAKQKECEEKLSEIEKDFAEREKRLEKYFESNHEAWENDIFSTIIGR